MPQNAVTVSGWPQLETQFNEYMRRLLSLEKKRPRFKFEAISQSIAIYNRGNIILLKKHSSPIKLSRWKWELEITFFLLRKDNSLLSFNYIPKIRSISPVTANFNLFFRNHTSLKSLQDENFARGCIHSWRLLVLRLYCNWLIDLFSLYKNMIPPKKPPLPSYPVHVNLICWSA